MPKHVRVKTGCLKCRSRKKKCDETKPVCRGCERNFLECTWPNTNSHPVSIGLGGSSFQFRDRGSEGEHGQPSPQVPPDWQHDLISFPLASNSPLGQNPSPWDAAVFNLDLTTPASSHIIIDDHSDGSFIRCPTRSPQTIPDPALAGHVSDASANHALMVSQPLQALEDTPLGEPRASPSFFPNHMSSWADQDFHDFGHYLVKTSASMWSGFTSSNPFLTFLVPLALSDDLLLNLILTQSALHRAITAGVELATTAQKHYDKSVSLFRRAAYMHSSESGGETLHTVGISALVLCFTEAIKGDKEGISLSHLEAAHKFLPLALRYARQQISGAFRDFIVEYYVYASTVAVLCMNPEGRAQFELPTAIKDEARRLAESRYTGNLCGCWLELLLLIPDIIHFDAVLHADQEANGGVGFPHEVFANFAKLQVDVLSWRPTSEATPEQATAGRLYQQALLLHLYTRLVESAPNAQSYYQGLVSAAVQEGLALLHQLPPGRPLDTILPWPIAVIGSCITDEDQYDVVQNRLIVMANTIGFRNIERIMNALALLRGSDESGQGPWALSRIFQGHNLGISLA